MNTSTGLPPAAGPSIRDACREPVYWSPVGQGAIRNLDILPDRFVPDGGCPTCGSVWIELDALKLSPITLIREMQPTAGMTMLAHGSQLVKGVRLLCFNGHTYEHVPIDLGMLALLGGALISGYALYGYMAGKRG